jgi:hypothetical protein
MRLITAKGSERTGAHSASLNFVTSQRPIIRASSPPNAALVPHIDIALHITREVGLASFDQAQLHTTKSVGTCSISAFFLREHIFLHAIGHGGLTFLGYSEADHKVCSPLKP